MRASVPSAIAISLLLMACTDPGVCTQNIEPGIRVRALEAGTWMNVTDGAQGAVERLGYQAVSLGGVEVTAGECHVNTVALDLIMVPIP